MTDVAWLEGARAARQRDPAADNRFAELFDRLAAGDRAALADLYRATADELYGLALWRTGRAADAADVVQEVFVKLLRRGSRLSTVRHPRGYLFTVAHRVAVDVVRRRRADEPLAQLVVTAPRVDLDARVDGQRLSRRLHDLPAAQRETIYLRHFAGLTFAEIGEITGVSTFTAASRYRLGIARLRRHLGGAP